MSGSQFHAVVGPGLSDVSERASQTDRELGTDGTDLIACCHRITSQTTLVEAHTSRDEIKLCMLNLKI